MTKKLRVAVVGCGALTRSFYVPALKALRARLGEIVFVDMDEERAKHVAGELDATSTTDMAEVVGGVDMAIVATPPASHSKIASEFLHAGTHVLVEKPLAADAGAAEKLVELARTTGCVLGVNNTRRLFPSSIYTKRMVKEGKMGRVVSIRYDDGSRFEWPTVSGFYFQGRGNESRGVIADRGAHVLDLLLWWLDSTGEVVRCWHDGVVGPEAYAIAEFAVGGAQASVRLSWLYRQANTFQVEFERGAIKGDVYDWNRVTQFEAGRTTTVRLESAVKMYADFARPLVVNFIETVGGETEVVVPGEAVLPSLRLLDTCYKKATLFDLPWYQKWRNFEAHGTS